MSNTVWKFKLESERRQVIEVPKGAKVIHVAVQGDDVCLWALVDPTAEKAKLHVFVVGTGWIVPDGDHSRFYLGTVHTHAGQFVWHIFARWEAA